MKCDARVITVMTRAPLNAAGEKMRIATIVILIACVIGTQSVIHAQAVRPVDMAVCTLQENTLYSPDQPKITLHVANAFKALPVLAFPIADATWAERYIFVENAPDKSISRMIVVQFEHALTGSAFRFVYPSKPPMQWGRDIYRHGAFTSDDAVEITSNPGKEVDRTHSFLKEHGYVTPNYWRIARLARVADAGGKSEIIIFYQEMIPPAQYVAPPNPDDNGLSDADSKALFARMTAAISPS